VRRKIVDDIAFFESLGEIEVRRRIDMGELPAEYNQGKKARAWLNQLEYARNADLEKAKLFALQSIPKTLKKKWYEHWVTQLLIGAAGSLVAWAILRYWGLA